MSGTSQRATKATATIVRPTAPIASPTTARQFAQQIALRSIEGRVQQHGATNSVSASWGSRISVGVNGISASAAPASATSAGYGAPMRRATAVNPAPISSSAMTNSNTLMRGPS